MSRHGAEGDTIGRHHHPIEQGSDETADAGADMTRTTTRDAVVDGDACARGIRAEQAVAALA